MKAKKLSKKPNEEEDGFELYIASKRLKDPQISKKILQVRKELTNKNYWIHKIPNKFARKNQLLKKQETTFSNKLDRLMRQQLLLLYQLYNLRLQNQIEQMEVKRNYSQPTPPTNQHTRSNSSKNNISVNNVQNYVGNNSVLVICNYHTTWNGNGQEAWSNDNSNEIWTRIQFLEKLICGN